MNPSRSAANPLRKVYIVGTGRMGSLVARGLVRKAELVLVGREPSRLLNTAREVGAGTAGLDEAFEGADAVILALPTEATAEVLGRIASRVPSGAPVINIATAVLRKDLSPYFPEDRLVGAKFVGQFREMAEGGKATIVVDARSPAAEALVRELFADLGAVVSGNEEWVRTVNLVAAEEGLRAAVRIQERLRGSGIPEELIQAGLRVVAPGSIKSFALDDLGPFGRTLAEKVRAEFSRDAHE